MTSETASADLPPADRVGAIILSAGASARMEGVDKMLADLGGKQVIAHALDVFEKCAAVGRIILVIAQSHADEMAVLRRRKQWRKLEWTVIGGARRQDSVRAGLPALRECDWIVVHDGARPFVTPALIEEGLRTAAALNAAVAAIPAVDTVKRVGEDGRVVETLDRRELVTAQTPQVFRRSLLQRAHEEVHSDVTDDAAMVEMIGADVYVFEGSPRNMKITTPEDLVFARALLRERA